MAKNIISSSAQQILLVQETLNQGNSHSWLKVLYQYYSIKYKNESWSIY